ncbi:hypothetical protein E1258_32630, partial [Micromonospora sp. KC207]|uniref:hypothetical protein n=1 Tax=Micromonospora sp. KC207 TaxID=2530377 RepID=UPI0010D8F9D9
MGCGPDGAATLLPDDSVAPYARQLADRDADVRRAGLHVLGELGDARPELRQRVVDAVCGYLRVPLPFEVVGELTAAQAGEVELRRVAQGLLTARLRPGTGTPGGPAAGPGHWAGMSLSLCGATLVDLASFHGDVTFAGARLDNWRPPAEVLDAVVFHATHD